jgi:ribosome maturation factor RimP
MCPFFVSAESFQTLSSSRKKIDMATRAELIHTIVEPVITALGCQLWGVEFLGQGKHTLLRIYVDKVGGVNVEDCAEVSHQVSSILDVEDPISTEYTLEVSSPGLDRMLFTLDQFRQYTGSTVKLRLSENFEGRRNFQGLLEEVRGDEIVLVAGEDKYDFPYELIEKANVVTESHK